MLKGLLALLAIPVLILGGFGASAALAAPSGQSGTASDFVGPIQFIGQVQEFPPAPSPTGSTSPQAPGDLTGTWKIQGLRVNVTSGTQIEGSPQVRSIVKVAGTIKSDGTVNAGSISVLVGRIEFSGFVQSLPQGAVIGTWKIEGLTVKVTAATVLKGTPQVGAFARVEGTIAPDGLVEAREIKVREFQVSLRGNDQDDHRGPPAHARGHGKPDKHDDENDDDDDDD